MKGARAFEHDGRMFILMDGVVAYHEDGDALSRRVSVALALTKQRGYLLSFFFAAPHDAELHELMNAKAAFDPEPAVKEASASAASKPRMRMRSASPGRIGRASECGCCGRRLVEFAANFCQRVRCTASKLSR